MPDPLTVPESDEQPQESRADFFRAKPKPILPVSQRVREQLSVSKSASLSPSSEAQYVESARRLNVPVETARHLPAEYLDPNAPVPERIAQRAPMLAQFMAASPTNATLAKDDWQKLSEVERIRSVRDATLKEQAVANARGVAPSIGESFDFGMDTVRLANAYWANYYDGNPQYMEWAAGKEKDREKYGERTKSEGTLGWLLRSATEQIPMLGAAAEGGMEWGLAGGAAAAGTALLAGQAGPQVAVPEELVTVPLAAAAGLGAGMKVGMGLEFFKISSAFAAHEFAQMKNLDGQPALNPAAAKVAGLAIGGISAGLEMYGFSKLMKTFPGIEKMPFFKTSIQKALQDPNVVSGLTEVGKKYATAVGAEMATEMGQEGSQILGNWIAANFAQIASDIGVGEKQDLPTQEKTLMKMENLSRIVEAGKTAFAASVVLGAPGTAISAIQEAQKIEDMKEFNQFLKDTNAKVHESALQAASPTKMQEFLQTAGQAGEVFITPEHAATLSPDLLAKVGITQEDVAEASEVTGQAIPTRMEDLHTKLTPEEFKQVLPGIKSGLTNPSEVEAATFDKTAEFERATAVADKKAQEEVQFRNSLKNIRKDLTKAVEELPKLREQVRAQGITAKDYADTVVDTLTAMTNRLALEGRERNEMLRKMTIGAVRERYAFSGGTLLREFKQGPSGVSWESYRDRAKGLRYRQMFNRPMGYYGDLSRPVIERIDRMFSGDLEPAKSAVEEIRKNPSVNPQDDVAKIDKALSDAVKGEVERDPFSGKIALSFYPPIGSIRDEQPAIVYGEPVEARRFKTPIHLTDGSRLSGKNDSRGTVLFGYDKNGEPFTIRTMSVRPEEIILGDRADKIASALHKVLTDYRNERKGEVVFRQDGGKRKAQGRTLVTGNIENEGAAPTSTREQAYIVDLFDGADLSTVLHEAAHVFLEEMRQIVSSGVASKAMLEEWSSLNKWLGVDLADPALSEAAYIKAHEQFARGVEEYFREGKSPSPELATAFERFKKWLEKIYATVEDLGPDRVALTDEVRATFDRLFATKTDTDAAVADSELVIRTDADLNGLKLSKEDRAKILELLETGRNKTEQSLQRRRDKAARAREKEWRDQAAKDVLTQPVYEAMGAIKEQGGLRWARIMFDMGEDTVKALRERGLIAAKEITGADPDQIAESNGFADATEMVLALLDAEPSRKAAVDKYVAERKAEHDAQFNAAESLTDAKEYAEYMELMGLYLGRAIGKDQPIKQAAFAEVAKNRLANMPLREAIKPEGALAAMQMALKAERRAVSAGDWQTALNANERARLNFELAKHSRKLKKDYERTMRVANENARADKGTIEEQHHLNMVALMENYGMLTGKPKVDTSKAVPLRSLVEPTESDAADPSAMFPEWILNGTFPAGAKSFMDMSSKEFSQVHDALWYLNGRGRAIVKDLLSDGTMTADAARDAVMQPLAALSDKKVVPIGSLWGKIIHGSREFFAWLNHFQTLMKAADGYTNIGPKGVMGPNEKLLYLRPAEAFSRKITMQDGLQKMLTPVVARLRLSMLEKPKYLTNTGVPFPEVLKKKTSGWTYEQVLSVALNMGNEYNRNAVAVGYGLTDAQIVQLTNTLSDSDWDAVQAIWDTIETLWPEIDAVHKRLNHFSLEKVEAKQFRTASGKIVKGGYYPVKFDSKLSDKPAEWTEHDNFMNSTMALFPQPSVPKTFTKARTGTGGMPLHLSLKVLGEHLDFATQYITHAEVIRDLDRVMTARHGKQANPYKQLFAQKFGDEAANLLQAQLKYLARPEGEMLGVVDRIIEANKGLATAYILGYNVKSAITNLTGVTNIMSEVGIPTFFKGAAKVMQNPMAAYEEMVALDPYMAKRAQLYDRDIRRQLDGLDLSNRLISGTTKSAIKNSAFVLLWAGDLAMTMPAWWGVYNKTMAETGGNTEASVAKAREAIASTNPSARPIDLNAFQRSNKGLHRLFTMFSSFTMRYGSRQRLHYNAWKSGRLGSLDYMRTIVLESMLPSMVMTVGYAMLWGNDPTDEDEVKHTLANLAIYQFQGLPFIRDVASAAIGTLAGEKFIADPTKSPAFTGYEIAQRVVGSTYRMVNDLEDDKKMEKAVWAFADLVAFKTGVPVPKTARTLMEGMRQWEEEDGTLWNVLVPDPDKKDR